MTEESLKPLILVQVNQKISKTAHIKELNAEIDRLKAELFATREKNGVYLPVEQYEQREELSKVNVARLENLELELEQIAAKHKARTEQLRAEISRLRQVEASSVASPVSQQIFKHMSGEQMWNVAACPSDLCSAELLQEQELGLFHQCMVRQPKALFHSQPTLWLATSSPVLSVGAGAGRDVRGL